MSECVDPFRDRTTYLDRDFQTYSLRNDVNLAPVDDEEETRLHEQHVMLLNIFNDRRVPLLPDFVNEPSSVLDLGYGTGDWASEVADLLPDSEVLAIDISPIMELGEMPDNLNQEIADLNDTLTLSSASFDFVHSRFLAEGIAHSRWPSYLTDIKRVLKDQGWVQLTEWELKFRSNNGNMMHLSALQNWSDLYLTALANASGNGRKSRSVPDSMETMLRMSGFRNVQSDVRDIPTCAWSSTTSMQKIGEQNLYNMRSLIRSAALYPITSRGVMSPTDFTALTSVAVEELGKTQAQPFIRLHTIYGQK